MKLLDAVILALAAGFFLIGIHQSFYVGVIYSYWLFMLTAALVLWFKFRKDKAAKVLRETSSQQSEPKTLKPQANKSNAKKRRK